MDLDSVRSGSVNEFLDLLEDEDNPNCESSYAIDIDDVDIPDLMPPENQFGLIISERYPKLSPQINIQPSIKNTRHAVNEQPKPTIRSVQGNQYRFGLIAKHKINTTRSDTFRSEIRIRQDLDKSEAVNKLGSDLCMKKERFQGNINDDLKQYFNNNQEKSDDQMSLNSFGTSAKLSPLTPVTTQKDNTQSVSVSCKGKQSCNKFDQ